MVLLPTMTISAVAAVLLLSNNAVDAFSIHVSVSCGYLKNTALDA